MKQQTRLILPALLIVVSLGCRSVPSRAPIDLAVPDARPVFRVAVADAGEAELLVRHANADIVRVEAPYAYVRGTNALPQLSEFGYVAEPIDPKETVFRVVKVRKRGQEHELTSTGVTLLLRERDHWIVRGSLAQLETLRAKNYRLEPIEKEPRPREVQIKVKNRSDIQRVAELGVDVLSVAEQEDREFLIYATAFDYQIDALRARQFSVTPHSTINGAKP